jgi:hypothetical protein
MRFYIILITVSSDISSPWLDILVESCELCRYAHFRRRFALAKFLL